MQQSMKITRIGGSSIHFDWKHFRWNIQTEGSLWNPATHRALSDRPPAGSSAHRPSPIPVHATPRCSTANPICAHVEVEGGSESVMHCIGKVVIESGRGKGQLPTNGQNVETELERYAREWNCEVCIICSSDREAETKVSAGVEILVLDEWCEEYYSG